MMADSSPSDLRQSQAVLTLALKELWTDMNPNKRFDDLARMQIDALAETHAQALALVSPKVLDGLTEGDLERISSSLTYHYEMTECVDEDEANQVVVNKLAALQEAHRPAPPRRSRRSRPS